MRIVSRLVVLAVVLALSVVAVAQANHTTTIYPGQVLQIQAVPWYNMPAGRICVSQPTVTLPLGW